jgi:hypothetical protein
MLPASLPDYALDEHVLRGDGLALTARDVERHVVEAAFHTSDRLLAVPTLVVAAKA